MVAKEYLDFFKVSCEFHNWIRDDQGKTVSDEVCGKPAVGVYVSDDNHRRGSFVCVEHARASERHGDGPVFWQSSADEQPQPQPGDPQQLSFNFEEQADVADPKSDAQG